ncbi:MAG TPA: hypothetical protein PK402_12065, partial [Tepidisphaeraceae bacterium]|nr:hypothetical protein [Tepidisphaeraceae bacterium]
AQGLEYASGNVNFDSGGNVDFNDLLIVSQNYGQNLVTAARASSAFASNIRITSETKKRGDGSVATSVLA